MNEIFEKYGSDPFSLCLSWYEDAKKTEINDPDAICLATSSPNGIPSARMVLIKDIDPVFGFRLHTNSDSRKGKEMAANNKTSFCWHWKSLRKQIRVEGTAHQVDDDMVDHYFHTRPKGRQIGAWASKQSSTFENWDDFQNAIKHYEEKFKDTDKIPRPEHWKGYWIKPHSIEFWMEDASRLHTRFIYTKTTDGWNATWLYP